MNRSPTARRRTAAWGIVLSLTVALWPAWAQAEVTLLGPVQIVSMETGAVRGGRWNPRAWIEQCLEGIAGRGI